MRTSPRAGLSLLAALALLLAGACGPPSDPEIVALTYVRATSGGDPDTAVQLLDLERMTARVEEEVVVVDSNGKETFLEDSIETLAWGLFRETRPVDYVYDATPAEIEGNRARVPVTRTAADGTSETIVVHLRNTDEGWRVSGESLDQLIRVVVQRLQEKY
jgi:hypothetical protein